MLPNASVTEKGSRRIIRAIPIAIAALAAACTDSVNFTSPQVNPALPASEVRPIPAPALSSLRPTPPSISSTCGAGGLYKLSDGTRIIGTVTVNNDANNIYVTYAVSSAHWWISDTRLALNKNSGDIPRDEEGAAEPWSFPEVGEHEPPITSVTHQVSLSSLGATAGQTVYVAAMAGVVHPRDENNYDGAWDWMVMWGLADTSVPSQVINAYVVNDCAPTGGETPPPTSAALITITFDDGWKTTITNAYPVLRDLGIKGNVAVNPQPIDERWTTYMVMSDLRTLWNAGWKIVSHSVSHSDLTTLSDADLDYELRESKAWLERNGFGPTDVFIVPFHSWGSRERAAIAKHYARARGHTVDEFWPERYVKMPYTQPYDLTAYEPEYAPFTTAAGRAKTIAKVDRAVQNGEFLDLMFHKVTNAQLPAFKLLMADVAKYKANISTW